MMQIMNVITDKPEWDHKVFDEQVTSTWRQEAARSGEDVTPKMMDWIIKELQWKAGILQKTGYVQVFDDGVLKSDTAISKELQIAVKDAVAALEDVPEEEKDYHPDSDDKVVDLVHPSLFPVIYGRTRVVPDRVIGLEHCLDSFGQGQTLPQPSDKEAVPQGSSGLTADPSVAPELSTKFQWLPCDFEYAENGRCHILSYINNAHPIKHRALYEVVERILAHTMPLWQKSLTDKPPQSERIVFKDVEYEEDTVPCPQPTDPSVDVPRLMDERAYYRLVDAWWDSRRIVRPEPGQFTVRKSLHDDLDFRKHFPDTKFQVIVKLANIELKPGKPNYEGGTWHMEGQLNERIVASAIYYYDNENTTPSSLAFRHRGMADMLRVDYPQDRHQFLQQIYGLPPDYHDHAGGLITQDLGSVATTDGRLITFPNTLQHRVMPFSLADPSRPGHRKILALFLVDPHRRIISSANVPPQRGDWRNATRDDDAAAAAATVSEPAITMEEAKAHRIELMKERGKNITRHNSTFEEGSFSLCEH